MSTRVVVPGLMVLIAILMSSSVVRADGFNSLTDLRLMHYTSQPGAGERVGKEVVGIGAGIGAYQLTKKESIGVRIGAGILASAVGGYVGRQIGKQFDHKGATRRLLGLVTGTDPSGLSLGVTYDRAPMATVGLRF